MTEIERLQKAILDLHGLESRHTASVPINETFEGKPVWEGFVEVFTVFHHPVARRAYAWSYKNDDGQTQYVAVFRPSIPLSMRFGLMYWRR
jgi:hypothetical protein